MEWELRDCKDAAGDAAREVYLTLIKGGKPGGPFWPQLIKNGPEIDASLLKRKEKDLEELMSELNASAGMEGMSRLQELKKSM